MANLLPDDRPQFERSTLFVRDRAVFCGCQFPGSWSHPKVIYKSYVVIAIDIFNLFLRFLCVHVIGNPQMLQSEVRF